MFTSSGKNTVASQANLDVDPALPTAPPVPAEPRRGSLMTRLAALITLAAVPMAGLVLAANAGTATAAGTYSTTARSTSANHPVLVVHTSGRSRKERRSTSTAKCRTQPMSTGTAPGTTCSSPTARPATSPTTGPPRPVSTTMRLERAPVPRIPEGVGSRLPPPAILATTHTPPTTPINARTTRSSEWQTKQGSTCPCTATPISSLTKRGREMDRRNFPGRQLGSRLPPRGAFGSSVGHVAWGRRCQREQPAYPGLQLELRRGART